MRPVSSCSRHFAGGFFIPLSSIKLIVVRKGVSAPPGVVCSFSLSRILRKVADRMNGGAQFKIRYLSVTDAMY